MPRNILENLYHRCPPALQHVFYSVKGWDIERTRHDRRFHAFLRQAHDRTLWSRESIAAYRDERLQNFIQHAAVTVPFYRRRFRDANVDPREIRTLADLRALPLLTRDEVREHADELTSEAVPTRQRLPRKTSGSSGTPLRIASTLDALREQDAIAWRFRSWHGIALGTWCAWIGGAREHVARARQKPPFWRINYPGRQIFFSSTHTTPEQLQHSIEALRRRRPPWVHGLPSNIVLYAGRLVETGEELGYPLRAITTAGEILLPQQAELIEQVFGTKPRERYVLTEAAAHASECELGSLHIDEDLAAVELLPDDVQETCRLVGTNFSNIAMPLLRYDTGDRVSYEGRICPCGRPGRVVSAVDGRSDDYIVLPDGSRMESFVLKDVRGISAAQIHQARVGSLTLRVVPDPSFGVAEQQALIDFAKRRVGPGTEVTVHVVDDVDRTPAGKARFMISDLPEGKAERVAEERKRNLYGRDRPADS